MCGFVGCGSDSVLTAGFWDARETPLHPPPVCVETTAWKEARKVSAAVNDGYLAGVPLRRDSGGICFSLASAWSAPQPPSLQAALVCDILFLLVCVREEKNERGEGGGRGGRGAMFLKGELMAGSGV